MASVFLGELQKAGDAPSSIEIMLGHQKSADVDGRWFLSVDGTGLSLLSAIDCVDHFFL